MNTALLDRSGATDYDSEVARLQFQAARTAIDLALADPQGLGGVVLRGRHGPVRDALLARIWKRYRMERLPAGSADEALDDTLDVTATLSSGRAVRREDLLARLDAQPHGALLVIGAERLSVRAADRLARWLESPARTAPVIALDESEDDQDDAPAFIQTALGDRLALHVQLPAMTLADLRACEGDDLDARPLAPSVVVPDERVAELVRLAEALGIGSARAAILAVATTRTIAGLAGHQPATLEHGALAARLVLAPRASRPPPGSAAHEAANDTDAGSEPTSADDEASEPDGTADETPADAPADPAPEAQDTGADTLPAPPDDAGKAETAQLDEQQGTPSDNDADALPEKLVAAVRTALPANLLASLASGPARRDARRSARIGAGATRSARGRPAGVARPGPGDHGRRLDIVATLKAAVPWQRLRSLPAITTAATMASGNGKRARLAVRPSDFRIRRYTRPTRTTTVFIVDASGSAAMHRIGEAKGALEAVLAECYVRRDRVALISFRGAAATLELPPTRSLARARRSLVGLAAGGGTPIATGLDLANELLQDIVRGGERAVGIIMSDGRANVGRDGLGGRPAAQADAEDAARRLAASGARLLFVDTAPRPRPVAAQLAGCMGARYLPLPLRGSERALPDLLAANGA